MEAISLAWALSSSRIKRFAFAMVARSISRYMIGHIHAVQPKGRSSLGNEQPPSPRKSHGGSFEASLSSLKASVNPPATSSRISDRFTFSFGFQPMLSASRISLGDILAGFRQQGWSHFGQWTRVKSSKSCLNSLWMKRYSCNGFLMSLEYHQSLESESVTREAQRIIYR
jgi:hypothetical protein